MFKPKPAEPPQWEYLQIVFYDYGGWQPRYVNEVELADWKEGPGMQATMQTRGNEGWELAGLVDGGRNQIIAYFKRPR